MVYYARPIHYVLNNAVGGVASNFSIDNSLALLSRGSLSGVLNGTTNLSTPGQVIFEWDDNSAEGNANVQSNGISLQPK